MKPEFCKFAHSVQELNIVHEEPKDFDMDEKAKRKKEFAEKR